MTSRNNNVTNKMLSEELAKMHCGGEYADVVNSLGWECNSILKSLINKSEGYVFNNAKPILVSILHKLSEVIADRVDEEDTICNEKQVWLNIETGEFSNSWTRDKLSPSTNVELDKLLDFSNISGNWKLITYECLTDKDFEFYNAMKIK